jgi:carbon monoxide dehydrogenase subunit G
MAQEIDVSRRIDAPPAAVWALLDDSSTWPNWTSIDSFELERGRDDATGLGEIRRFKTGPVTVREEIVEREAERRLSYRLLGGLPVRDYVAEIDLAAAGAGTDLRWHTTFDGKLPATGWFFRAMLGKATRDFVAGLDRAARDG